jgi:hypothetical protein
MLTPRSLPGLHLSPFYAREHRAMTRARFALGQAGGFMREKSSNLVDVDEKTAAMICRFVDLRGANRPAEKRAPATRR